MRLALFTRGLMVLFTAGVIYSYAPSWSHWSSLILVAQVAELGLAAVLAWRGRQRRQEARRLGLAIDAEIDDFRRNYR